MSNQKPDMFSDIWIYPQASSYLFDTWEPVGDLAKREEIYKKKLGWHKWAPKSLLDVGMGKGFYLRYWKSAKSVQASDIDCPVLERVIERFPEVEWHIGDYLLSNPGPVELLLLLRNVHYMWFKTLDYDYVVKAATTCYGRCVIETAFDHEQNTIKYLRRKYSKKYHPAVMKNRLRFLSEENFKKEFEPYFILENDFPATYKGYHTYSLKRKMPPVIKESASIIEKMDTNSSGTKTIKLEGSWYKATTTHMAMQYLTIMQYMGHDDILQGTIIDEDGCPIGFKFKHIERTHDVESVEAKEECALLNLRIITRFAQIGLFPSDVVPVNVIDGRIIDMGCLFPMAIIPTGKDKGYANLQFALDKLLRVLGDR